MNKNRRKQLDEAIAHLESVKSILEDARETLNDCRSEIEDAKSLIEQARDDEQEYKDNMPEAMQDGEKGSRAEEAINELEAACGSCEDIDVDDLISTIDDVIANCENAKNV